ncbi:hypothetical protein IFO69_15100 [Echinicola sp. CAU 1574]|uniref:EpsG family protein n=1 Tax=Echinicola arenosa TaxID=2774144 RepID=A0ABR9AQE9_9BACT|nr:hypothetical protein [Echinicola arenosa]MBD8490083.1 hypothetical protein [Echinicola arenosa]
MIKFISVLIFFISLSVLSIYTKGDQELYIKAYESFQGINFFLGYVLYYKIIGSNEPVYYFLAWGFSILGVPKIVFASLANSILALTFIRLGKKYGVSVVVLVLLCLTNFYFIAVYTELERLKFGLIFFLLSLYHIDDKKKFYFFVIVTVFTHLQFSILYLGMALIYIVPQIKRIFSSLKLNKNILYLGLGIVLVFFIMKGHILRKLGFYYEGIDLVSCLKALPLSILSVYYSKRRGESLIINFVLLLAIMVVGSDRMIVLVFFSFLYYALQYKRGINWGVIITMVYFGIKSIGFLVNVIENGRGY